MRILLVLLLLAGCAGPPEPSPGPAAAQTRTEPPEQRRGASGLLRTTPEQEARIRTLCAEAPAAPEGAPWTGLMNDSHVHTAMENDQSTFAIALLEEMNGAGVQRALLQPDHAPGLFEHAGFLQAVRAMEASWAQLASLCSRLVPMVYAFDPDDPGAIDYVRERLDTGWYGGVGEVELQHVHLPISHAPRSPTMEAIYDLLDERQLLLHFQASPRLDPSLTDTVLSIAREHPGARFLWFSCPPIDQTGWPPNLGCGTLVHAESRGVRDGERGLWGSDAAPSGFKNSSRGVLPYDDVTGAVAQARTTFAQLDEDPSGLAATRFDALVPTLPTK